MKRFPLIALCAVAFATLLCVKPHSVSAQQSEWRQIRLHNVRPNIMAYLIDPKNQKEPLELVASSAGSPDSSPQNFVNAMTLGTPKLNFDGVLAVDNKQNALWVLSSQDAFDQTKRFVDFMDRPISQCELAVQVVKISKEDLKLFATKPIQPVQKTSSQQLPYKFGILAEKSWGALQPVLVKLVSQGKAKIINSPRVTTLNHLTGSIASSTSIPVFVGIKNKNTSYDALPIDPNNNHQIGITKQLHVAFTPDINDTANTMSVNLDVSAKEGITNMETMYEKGFYDHHKVLWFRDQVNPPLTATINVNSTQTVLITGLNTAMLGYGEKQDNVAVFLTVRIIHRSEG